MACLAGGSAWGADTEAFEKEIRPLVGMYCVECHRDEKLKGDLNLARFANLEQVTDALAVWQRAGMRLQNKEMPPRNAAQPSDDERARLVAWIGGLEERAADCDRIASEESVSWYPGYVMSRRLNRAEYENTLRDLLGAAIEVADMFPADGAGGEGFDTAGGALFLSAIQVEKYVLASELAVEQAIPASHRSGPAASLRLRGPSTPVKHVRAESERAAAVARRALIGPSIRGAERREAAQQRLASFAERAWRRPVEPEEVGRIVEIFDRAAARGDGYDEAMKLALKAVLVSPNFVFLAEPEPPEQGNYALGDFPLASRVSYFLWGSMPDAELFELARQGRLQDEAVLTEQVRRMLRDPKAAALGEMFASQWLGISQLGETTRPDPERFPEYDDALRDSMRAEAAHYFNRIFSEDRSLLELLDSDYVFANERLAGLYGLESVTGEKLRVVQVADAARGGVLGMAAVLTATSHPLRTSPVLRGKWVLEQLLGDRVPPPPPDAGTLPEDDVQPDGLSFRARMEAHRERAECASCHARMDPIGFGLENFDPIGRWRDEQAGQPVDAAGELPSGEKFSGPKELKAILLARKDDFVRHLSRKMLGYALGRNLTKYDSCVVDDCVAALQASGYRPSSLITQIVLSYPFRHRYSGGAVRETE